MSDTSATQVLLAGSAVDPEQLVAHLRATFARPDEDVAG
jgi:hypothetical protein